MILISVAAKAAVARLCCACLRLNDGRGALEKMTIARSIAAMARVNADRTTLRDGVSC